MKTLSKADLSNLKAAREQVKIWNDATERLGQKIQKDLKIENDIDIESVYIWDYLYGNSSLRQIIKGIKHHEKNKESYNIYY